MPVGDVEIPLIQNAENVYHNPDPINKFVYTGATDAVYATPLQTGIEAALNAKSSKDPFIPTTTTLATIVGADNAFVENGFEGDLHLEYSFTSGTDIASLTDDQALSFFGITKADLAKIGMQA